MTKDNTIHISGELHKQMKLYCVEKNLNIKQYVENLISIDLNNKLGLDGQGKPLYLEPNEEAEKELERLLSKL